MFLSAGVNEASDPPTMLGNAKRVSGKWAGTYECFQGEVAATLTLTGHKNGTVEGDFLFYPTSSNPKTATGRFISPAPIISTAPWSWAAGHGWSNPMATYPSA